MRRILVEQARRRRSQRRGGGWGCIPLDEMQIPAVAAPDYLDLDELLDRLKRFDERGCRIVELHVFGGLTSEEIAAVLGMGESTVRRDWTHARIWLEKELQRPLQ
jgi:RNA polymerase sigma-70 factor, ECF subfamily